MQVGNEFTFSTILDDPTASITIARTADGWTMTTPAGPQHFTTPQAISSAFGVAIQQLPPSI